MKELAGILQIERLVVHLFREVLERSTSFFHRAVKERDKISRGFCLRMFVGREIDLAFIDDDMYPFWNVRDQQCQVPELHRSRVRFVFWIVHWHLFEALSCC